jgi:hypothetical protein
MAARMAMMAITTRSSIRVKPMGFICLLADEVVIIQSNVFFIKYLLLF